MLKIKTKDGQEINLSESDIREIIKESIEEAQTIMDAKAAMDSFCNWKAKKIIFEGLIKTYSVQSTLNMLRKISKGTKIGTGAPSNRFGQKQIYISFNTGFDGIGDLFGKIIHLNFT